jgi:hypothetical protein
LVLSSKSKGVIYLSVEVKKINYAGWPNCYQLSDGTVEVVATGDVGPRLIRCGFINEQNFFAEFAEQIGKTGAKEWNIYGGHRLWHSPETRGRCYHPDNSPITVKTLPNGLQLTQPVEPNTAIEKEIIVTLEPSAHCFTVEHKMTNRGNWPVNFALWALSVMNTGGVGIFPQYRTPDAEGLLSNRQLALWSYTDLNDSRINWGSRYTLLTQDTKKANPFKFGLSIPENWAAYALKGQLFLKKFSFNPQASYPDGGVNVETYTCDRFLELETLSPLHMVAPGQTVSYTENWLLFKGISEIKTEADVEKSVIPLVAKA